MKFNDHLIPVERGQAVSKNWTRAFPYPKGVTWHWTATWDLETCRRILGGPDALRKGKASAHFGVGRNWDEGIDRYVGMSNRSWHAGAGQTLTWDGRDAVTAKNKASRTTIGVETVHIGYARRGVKAKKGWTEWASYDGRHSYLIPPWPVEQIRMMISLGGFIQGAFPYLTAEDHHGHADVCPGRKVDVLGFPWVHVLDGIYGEGTTVDVWTPYQTVEQRQQALIDAGYDLGRWGADGDWGRLSSSALEDFQQDQGIGVDGYWTVFTARAIHKSLQDKGEVG